MEHRLINNGAIMPSSDKQQSVSVRKMPLSDLPNGTRNAITSPHPSSLPREKGPFSDSLKVSGMKRRLSDYPPGPHNPSTCNNGTNGPLVYVRRKLEESGKVHNCGNVDVSTSLKRKFSDSERKGLSHQPDQIESRVSCSPAFSPLAAASLTASSCGMPVPIVGKPTSLFLPMEPGSLISSGIPVQTNSPSSNRVHWKERFLRLQMFLNSCDQSNQEEYNIQMLRSLSSVGRSKHAVELEKRAIHLILEEGKELHRMKLLNVLGKVSP